jgi:glyoxylase-like metal-dependent hydrolase (beta-lactamase superfamily II)
MFPVPNRRDFLETLLCGGAALSWPRCARGAQRPEPGLTGLASGAQRTGSAPFAVTRLASHLLLIAGAPGNVVVAAGPGGSVMVNGGDATHSADLLRLVASETGSAPLRTLFNTDWHPEHTGSNELLAGSDSDVAIVAHEHTKQYLGTEIHVDWQERTYKPRPRQAWPTKTFYTKGTMTVGTEAVEYGHLGQAHTDGDIYVFFRDANVLVVGDVLTVGAYPVADYTTGGWLGGLATATKALIDLSNADTRVVPGAGPVQSRADLQAQFEMLSTLRDRMAKMMRQGLGADEMLAAGVSKEFDARWGNPNLFVSTAYRGLWLHAREMGGLV